LEAALASDAVAQRQLVIAQKVCEEAARILPPVGVVAVAPLDAAMVWAAVQAAVAEHPSPASALEVSFRQQEVRAEVAPEAGVLADAAVIQQRGPALASAAYVPSRERREGSAASLPMMALRASTKSRQDPAPA
jgi:hypothetical protein